MGLTLAEGGHLMDKRFMSDVERDTAGRFKLIFGDVTDTPHDMLFAPDGARLPAGSAPQFDLVIAGARSSKSVIRHDVAAVWVAFFSRWQRCCCCVGRRSWWC